MTVKKINYKEELIRFMFVVDQLLKNINKDKRYVASLAAVDVIANALEYYRRIIPNEEPHKTKKRKQSNMP